jgi:hypothetical protein
VNFGPDSDFLLKDFDDEPSFGLVFHLPKSLKEVKSKIRSTLKDQRIVKHQEIIAPFLSLNISNAPAIYAVVKTYLSDISSGKKNFGFTSVAKNVDDLTILGIGSCISYSMDNSPVLMVVNNINSPEWDKYRSSFSIGQLGKWKTYDWANLCFIDYNEILSNSMESIQFDLKVINEEFSSVLWALPSIEQSNNLKQFYITVFKNLDSVALILPKLPVDYKKISKIEKFYSSIGVRLKGILKGG